MKGFDKVFDFIKDEGGEPKEKETLNVEDVMNNMEKLMKELSEVNIGLSKALQKQQAEEDIEEEKEEKEEKEEEEKEEKEEEK